MVDVSDPRPQQLHIESRYRRFAPAQVLERDGAHEAHSTRPGHVPVLLDSAAVSLARLFDGQRRNADIALAATQMGEAVTPQQVEGFAAELGQAGLLFAGTHEPLPVPAYTEAEVLQLGWGGGATGLAGRPIDAAPLPPSTVPGSRAYPGLVDAPGGLIDRATQFAARLWPLRPEFFVALGRLFAWSYGGAGGVMLCFALAIGAIAALEAHRFALLQSALDAWRTHLWLLQVPLAAYLVNAVACGARAHAIARWSPEQPRCVVQLGFLNIPVFAVQTRGVIERTGMDARLRIIGAPLQATLVLATLAALAWLMSVRTDARLAQFFATLAAAAWVSWLLRVNPLAKRDGYLWATHRLGVLDLREQALAALFKVDRPWLHQLRKLPRGLLAAYAVLCAVFLVVMLTLTVGRAAPLLSAHYGGIGILFALGLMGAYMFRQIKDSISAPRGSLGVQRDLLEWRPRRNTKIILGVIAVLMLFPYRYEPSGDMVVLPQARADVRALVPGDVRQVLVAEGDTVKAGQVIAHLSDAEPRARVAQSEAALAQAESDLALLKKGAKNEELDVARQRVATARKKADVSRENAQRVQQAFQKKGVTAFDYDRARGNADVDAQELLEAQRQLDLIASPALNERMSAKDAEVAGARATLEYNRKQLADTEIKSPIAGRIVSGSLKFALGTYLQRGELLAQVEDASTLIAQIQLPESSVGEIQAGNPASAKVWAYPGTTFSGVVTAVAPAAESTPYGKVVRVQMSLQDPDGKLKPEMTGSGKAAGDRHMAIVVYTRALMRFLWIEVWSWLP